MLRNDISQVGANLTELNRAVGERLALADERTTVMRPLLNATRLSRRLSEPGKALLEAKLARWHQAGDAADPLRIEDDALADTVRALLPQQRAEVVVGSMAKSVFRIAVANDQPQTSLLGGHVRRSLAKLEGFVVAFPANLQARAQEQLQVIRDGFFGPRGLIALRSAELDALGRANAAIDQNVEISARLTDAFAQLVSDARGDIDSARADVVAVQNLSTHVLIAVALASLLCSGLIVWLYVQRHLLKRLTALSGSMLAVAGGNLRVPLPSPQGDDEIDEMTRALTVFRDTAVEVEDKNLRELDLLLDRIDYGVLLLEPDLRVRIHNRAYRAIWGIPEDFLERRPLFREILEYSCQQGVYDVPEEPLEVYVQHRIEEIEQGSRHVPTGAAPMAAFCNTSA